MTQNSKQPTKPCGLELDDLRRDGFLYIPEVSSLRFVEIMSGLGSFVQQPRTKNPIKELTLSETGDLGTFSATFGLAAIPPHTDGAHLHSSPRFVGFRLATATSIALVASPVYDTLGSHEQRILKRATWLVKGAKQRFLSPILGNATLRYDPLRFVPYHSECNSAINVLADALLQTPAVKLVGTAGQLLIIDNWRCLHWRMPGVSREVGIRKIQRIIIGNEHA